MDIASLPYFTPLVKDYLARFDATPIRDFFAISPEAPHEQMREIIDARLLRERAIPSEHRSAVVSSIRSLHASFGPMSDAAAHHLELLEQPETLAVVTGQQPGMIGGPLYTFYKAFTAIELSKSLAGQFPMFSFVPVFWIETEDHDLEEISSVHVLSSEGLLETIQYVPSQIAANPEQPWRRQAGPFALEEESLQQFFSGLASSLAPTDFSAELFELLRRCYTPGRSIAHAFASLFAHYFRTEGLLAIDANSRELKSLATELFRREIETSPQLSDRIVLQSEKLEETYHAQVKPRALNLFYVNEEGERLPIVEREKSGEGATLHARSFFLKGSRKSFTLSELLAVLDEHPERFSPNVVMRPLYQDSLLPTVAYVAGPGEMAYFAQFQPLYEWAGLPMPLIRPRVTSTLIEERLERLFSKFRISPEDVLSEAHGRNTALLNEMIESGLAPKFEEALVSVDGSLEALRETVARAEPTLDGALTSLKGKVLTAIRDFEHKTLAAERKRHTATKAQLDKLLAALLPAAELQERELNLVYFLNKYGPSFSETLKQLLRPFILDFHEHHIIHLLQTNSVSKKDIQERRTSAPSERLSAPAT